jgi:hypothetical protein
MTRPSRAWNTLSMLRNVVHWAKKGHAHAMTREKTTGETASCSHKIQV